MECESTGKSPPSKKEEQKPFSQWRGEQAEAIVREHFLALGCSVQFHRHKIFGVEYDWVFRNPPYSIYVEVKSVKSTDFFLKRWPWRQRQRFLRVASLLAEQHAALFYLALVDTKNKVHLFKVGEDI